MALDSPPSVWTQALVALVVFLLVGSGVWWLAAISPRGLVGLLLGLLVIQYLFSKWRRNESDDSTEDSSSSVWNAIPGSQYYGRHAESGGLARGEQEQALEEIQDDAEKRHAEQQHTENRQR